MEGQGRRGERIFMSICFLLCLSNLGHSLQNGTVQIGVLLDFNSWVGRVAKAAINLAEADVNNDKRILNGTQLVIQMLDDQSHAIVGASAAIELLNKEVVAIIGPQTSDVSEFVSHVGDAANVPIVSFSATSPLLSSQRFPYFVRIAPRDDLQMKAIAAVVKAYSWRKIVVIYPDNDFGSGAISSLSDALRDIDSEIEYRSPIPPIASREEMREELYKLMNMQSRVFVAHMGARLGLDLFDEAQKIGMMEAGYVWIITDGFASLLDVVLNSSTVAFMQGVIGIKSHIPPSDRRSNFTKRWKREFRRENPEYEGVELNNYGLLAYDAVQMVARAIGSLGSNASLHFLDPLRPSAGTIGILTDLRDIKVFQEGNQLLNEIGKTNFTGLSGHVQLVNGDTAASTYEIVNVVGQSYHVVGYWTDKTLKLSRALQSESVPASNQNRGYETLGPVIWPGRSTQVPRGWVIPTIGKNLQIGVPLKHGFKEFVMVTYDEAHNGSIVSGFCKDVFDAVLGRMDYALPYDLIPYAIHTYDDLVYQVYLQKFDAVMGDTTILGNRSNYVDFTQPYSETGMVMVVPIKTDDGNNAWAFLQPFTPGMWCATAAFFVFTGVVVWVLEHRINPTFRGTPSKQVVTLLWVSFSTLYFTHRERILSSLSRLVIIIWLFVVLILTSSYTASLTSILTVRQIKPMITSVDSLIARGAPVGYQEKSFIREYLHDQLGIAPENLKSYSTSEEFADALAKGTKNGGVAAIFDEIPYVRLFLSKQCGYTMVGPTYRTGGFGFVFPKGSPLVSDISRAVSSFSEDKEMRQIEAKYFNTTMCTTPGANVDSNRLSMDSFWGLYVVTGAASAVALLIFFCRLLYRFMRDPNIVGQENSKGKSIKSFAKYLDRKKSSLRASQLQRFLGKSNSPSSTRCFRSPSPGREIPLSRSASSTSQSGHEEDDSDHIAGGGNASAGTPSVSIQEISVISQ